MSEKTGLDSLYLWVADDKAKLKTGIQGFGDSGVFWANLGSAYGATNFNIQNLSPTTTAVYGSDAVAERLLGTAAPTVTCGANDLPADISGALLGATQDSTNGGLAYKGSHAVYGGVIGVTHNKDNKEYICFPFGIWTQSGGMNLQTNTQNAVAVHDSFILNAQNRPSDNLLCQFYSDSQDNFSIEKMLAYIVEGYKAAASTPGAVGGGSAAGGSAAGGTTPAGGSDAGSGTNPDTTK